MADLENLWGEDFELPPSSTKKIVEKIKKPKKVKIVTQKEQVEKKLTSKSISIEEKIKLIEENVYKVLGKHVEDTLVIKDRQTLHDYISKAIENGEIAIDTETNNSLDPITCKLMGPCIYTPNTEGDKQVYIPINHVDLYTRERLPWQLTEQDIKEEFQRLIDNEIFIIMHNGKFDYKVIKCTAETELTVDWDTMIAAKMLDENEKSAGLKQQYIAKIDPDQEKYSIEKLFEKMEYAIFNPDVFALYAATDAKMTYQLYKWQKNIFEKPENKKLYDCFLNIEMKVIPVVAQMELEGIELDKEYANLLSKKYHKKLEDVDLEINEELNKYQELIAEWRLSPEANKKDPKKISEKGIKGTDGRMYGYSEASGGPGDMPYWYDKETFEPLSPNKVQELNLSLGTGKSKSEQLEDPINLGSPTQLAILFYDILKVKVIDKKKPRGTGEDILVAMKNPLANLLVKRRGIVKLIDAFIDSLPQQVNPATGRIHCSFNQLGAATGRFSSSEPNLQQIPSSEKSIRLMFKARDGYMLLGSDFSQQEPRLLSQYSHDEAMIDAYKQGKDLYATIASGVYKNTYWDNMEKHEDGTPNPDGKKRRASCKSLLLGKYICPAI